MAGVRLVTGLCTVTVCELGLGQVSWDWRQNLIAHCLQREELP